jgi:hypothetical protein
VPENHLRQGQLIGTFGPGAFVDLPERSVIMSGVGDWQKQPQDKIAEPRLLEYLRRRLTNPELQLFAPPPLDTAPDAPKLGVAGIIYPTWFVTQEPLGRESAQFGRRLLIGIDATEQFGRYFQDPYEKKRRSLTPIRFVVACRRGHTSDVDWRSYVHRAYTDCRRTLWIEERGTSGEVADTWVGCDCGQQRQLYEALDISTQPAWTLPKRIVYAAESTVGPIREQCLLRRNDFDHLAAGCRRRIQQAHWRRLRSDQECRNRSGAGLAEDASGAGTHRLGGNLQREGAGVYSIAS